MTGTLPAGVSSQRWNPATFSSIFPLTAGIFGPQQGALSEDVPHSGGCAINGIGSIIAALPQARKRPAP
jgi:hypothetical protein